jgi:hypothetical protein
MIITAWYLGTQVLLGVPEDSLVYDGRAWVTPSTAKYVALITRKEVEANLPIPYQTAYEEPSCVPPVPPPLSLTFNNMFLCKVLSVSAGSMPQDVLAVPAPVDFCLCGVTCVGTEIVDVPVYVETQGVSNESL